MMEESFESNKPSAQELWQDKKLAAAAEMLAVLRKHAVHTNDQIEIVKLVLTIL